MSTVETAAKIIGLSDDQGFPSPNWISDPFKPLTQILSNDQQRQALQDLLDQLWPPQNPTGVADNEKWHPILGPQTAGNLYLTVANGSRPLTIGVAGEAHSAGSPGAALRARLPLVTIDAGAVKFVAGTKDAPFELELRVELDWSVATGQTIGLKAIRASAVLQPRDTPAATLKIVLEGLSVGGAPPKDTELDAANLDSQAVQLVAGLLQEELHQIASGSPAAGLAALAKELVPVLGLASGIPPLPLLTLVSDPAAFRNWADALISAGKAAEWLGHLGGLFGVANTAAGSGTTADPWTIPVFAIDANSAVSLTLAQTTEPHTGTRRVEAGVQVSYKSTDPGLAATIQASAVLASIPLSGPANATAIPSASITVSAPGGAVATAIRGGAVWNGVSVTPLLELDGVNITIDGSAAQYDRIDLTNTDSVISAATGIVSAAITSALGSTGAGAHLAALAGITKPAGDPAWSHVVKFSDLVSNPAQAIAAVHRAALLDPTHNWAFLLSEVAGLVGLAGAVSGTGTQADPWIVPLATGTPAIDLAAWNAQTSHNAADTQQLRLGLRASAASAPWSFQWLCELLAFDLPQSGDGRVALMAGQHASLLLQPVPAGPASLGVTVTADSVGVTLDYVPGSPFQGQATISGLTVASGADSVHFPTLTFPPAAGFSVTPDVEKAFRLLFSVALASWTSDRASALPALLGLNGNAFDLPADWPLLAPGFLTGPFAALRTWLGHLTLDVSSTQTPFLPRALELVAALFSGLLLPDSVSGSGLYDDSWVIPISPAVDLLTWLEPAGPPPGWVASVPALIGAAGSFSDIFSAARSLAAFLPGARASIGLTDSGSCVASLQALSSWMATSDGFVPIASQIPATAEWTSGTLLTSAHTMQPADPAAISQINAQVAAWNPTAKVVLLIGPGFSDHGIWDQLLAAVPVKPSFNFRLPGMDPAVVDLHGVTDAADFYTADLQDNGLAGVTAQIARVVARLGELRPGVKVTLIAHSTAGVAARAFSAANPTLVQGLITLGTPHSGSTLDPLSDLATGAGLRNLGNLVPKLAPTPLNDAIIALTQAADGYLPAAQAGDLPVAAPFPVASFADPGSTETGGVPALAIGSVIAADSLTEIKSAFASAASGIAGPAPTHLGLGVRARVDFGIDGDVQVDAFARADMGRIALSSGAAEPSRPAHALNVYVALSNPDGWLAGSPSSPERVRWMEMGIQALPNKVAPWFRLHDAGFHSPSLGIADENNPNLQSLLGVVFRQIASPPPASGTALANLLAALGTPFKVVVPSADGTLGISADALLALKNDAVGFLSSQLNFTTALGSLFQISVTGSSATLRSVSPDAPVTMAASLSLPALTPSLEVSFTLGAATVSYSQATGKLLFSAPPWIAPTTDIVPALIAVLPRILLSSAGTAILQSIFGPDFTVRPLDAFLSDVGGAIRSADALGTGSCLDSSKISNLLQRIAAAISIPSTGELPLPGNLKLTATGTGLVNLQLATTAPIGGILNLDLGVQIDCSLHVTPTGSVVVTETLPGSWGTTSLRFTIAPSGVTLTVEPTGVAPIQILPTFSGLGALAGGAKALLPAALDQLAAAVPASTLSAAALQLATALDLYDPGTGFSGHSTEWKTLLAGDWAAALTGPVQAAASTAISNVLNAVNSAALGSAGVAVNVGWDSQPTVSLSATGIAVAGGAVSADLALGYKNGAILAKAGLNLNLNLIPGIKAVPQVSAEFASGQFNVTLTPGTSDVVGDLLLPLAATLVLTAEKANFSKLIWTGGPSVLDLLQNAKIATATGDLASPIPAVTDMVAGIATGLAAHASLTIGTFVLAFVSDGSKLGVRITGTQPVPSGDVDLTVHFGTSSFSDPGVTVWVLDSGQFVPSLEVRGLGIELGGASGGPLINSGGFRLQSAAGYLFFTFDGSLKNLGGAIGAQGLGLPLNQLGGSNDGGNPVASSLVEGVGTGGGDPNPVNPAVDVLVSYVDGVFDIALGGKSPIWIGVHRSFGPVYIDQIGVEWDNASASLLIDATIQVGGLTVQAFELTLKADFKELLSPSQWTLDLMGLGVGFDAGPVSIAGGLLKNPGPPLDYDGMLSAVITGIGLTVVGGYSRPNDGQGSYTSLFLFVSLPIPLGGPPFLFVTGLGGGAGYNRQLTQPSDINQLPSYFLIKAIDDSSLANDPMGALVSMGKFVAPRRGAFWLAAGVRFNSFVVVNSVVAVWVSLDRGFDLGAIGVARMQLPAPDIALVSIELALMIKYSEAEGYFGCRAQLTDNSWIFSSDCQLTGGFAFYIFFNTGHFVLTMGGYHPAFNKPPEFPDIPRLGFNWQVLGFVQIKGQAYFAITSSAFMCGGGLEASAGIGGIRFWFTVHCDILIQWDPFHYDFDAGIEVGVSLTIHVCFFGCVDIGITISKGADMHIFGPPFHADVTFDAYITTITLSFGGDPHPRPDPLLWEPFRDKYLVSGNPENTWVGVRMTSGLLLPDPPGASPSPGKQADPWKLNPEWSFVTESRMPASGYSAGGVFDNSGAVIQLPFKTKSDSRLWDLAPMDVLKVGSVHRFIITPPVTHPDQFEVAEIMTLLPEANWVYYDPAKLPAAANRINAITGLSVTATAKLLGKSALIPIGTLKDDDPRFAQPLPFETVLSVVGTLQAFGLTSEALAAITAGVTTQKTLQAATQVLSGTNTFFADARTSSGVPAAGLSPLAVRALQSGRSSPPLITPLTTGLSMKPVQLALPPAFFRPPALDPVPLDEPRLRAVMQHRPLPAVDAPAAVRTTTLRTSAPNAPRMAPPRLNVVAGARLDFVPALTATRPTAVTLASRTLRNPGLGALAGSAHAKVFTDATANIAAKGITVPSGTTHVWELSSPAYTLTLQGQAAVRITMMNRAGQTIGDLETAVSGTKQVPVSGVEFLAITCLGSLPELKSPVPDGEGAITFAASAGGATPAVGWQAGNLFPQVGGSCILARGAALRLRKAYVPTVRRQPATQSMIRISDAMVAQSGAETWLPVAIGVVMILLDLQDATAADSGDLGIACDGATLATPPVAGTGGRRRALLYDVVARDPKATRISVSVASKTGWSLAGVIGLPGRAAEWAARLNGAVPPDLVPNGPLTPSGQILVQLNVQSTASGGVS
jgi:hypothetical protein